MVLLDVKKEASNATLPLNTTSQELEEGVSSFSTLLKGKTVSNEKFTQNDAFVLALQKEENTPLSKVLETSFPQNEQEIIELDPKVTASLTPKELKVLIKEAKQFLKDKIIQSEGFKRSEIDALPKTLNGLAQVAKKIGIDITKITLEEVKAQTPKIGLKGSAFIDEKLEKISKNETISTEKQLLNAKKDINSNSSVNNELSEGDFLVKQSKKSLQKPLQADEPEIQESLGKKEQQNKLEARTTPLFKAQSTSSAPEITTQQIVHAKVNTSSPHKTPKQKADDTLQLLLQGEKASKNESGLQVEFSTATARVIAPQATKESQKSLSALLHNEMNDATDVQSKSDGLSVAKADSFEVKLNEAKQMVKYLSQDVKSAIEDYKSPFTRVKVQLNPQRLGEVDLTIVQRGKNLHINLSSNNTAINTLAMNANDLKVQLNNNGINNATLNFNSNPQGDNSQAGQQEQHRQHQQRADEEYNYFESQEGNEEVLSSLEIIVPHYA